MPGAGREAATLYAPRALFHRHPCRTCGISGRLPRLGALDAGLVGETGLEAVRENEFYMFTHSEKESLVEARRTDMAGAFGCCGGTH